MAPTLCSPTITPTRIFIGKRDASGAVKDWKEASVGTKETIEITPTAEPFKFAPVKFTATVKTNCNTWKAIRSLFGLRQDRRLTYKTIRTQCAKRNQ